MKLKSGIIAIWIGTALLLGGCVGRPHRPKPPPSVHLHGSVHGTIYTSPEGGFSVPFPVSLEVHGRISNDSADTVTFVDDWGSHITFYGQAISQNSPMMPMLKAEGREKALTDFARHVYGNLTNIDYHPDDRGGMISFLYLKPASRKTAVAVFVHGSRLYLAETDELPGEELLAQNDEQSQLDREAKLEARAVDLANSMDIK